MPVITNIMIFWLMSLITGDNIPIVTLGNKYTNCTTLFGVDVGPSGY